MTADPAITVALADDHTILRAGVRQLIDAEPDMRVIAEAANGAEAVVAARRDRPDVFVMDIDMPVMNGIEACRQITEAGLPTKVLVLTMHADEQHLLDVLQAGGAGYVRKDSAETDLLDAIRTVNRGEAFLYPSGIRLALQSFLHKDAAGAARKVKERLSEREQQVLTLTAEGFSNHEIGQQLYLSSKTVDTYRQRIMEKLDLHHRSELVHYALDRGFLKARER